jgi:NADH-quinone oxidoreductase subunit L
MAMLSFPNIAYLIPLLPLLGFLVNGLLRNHLSHRAIALIGSGVMALAFGISLLVFYNVPAGAPTILTAFDFIRIGELQIPFAFQLDALSSLFLLIITGIGFLIHVYSSAYMHEESASHYGRYFAYLNLFVFSMLLLVMGANYVILFIGWEGVGLCSYLLIGYWFRNTAYSQAANKAFVMNRIGDLAFLIAIFWLIARTGSVSFTDLPMAIGTAGQSAKLSSLDITGITLLLFIGATGKSAQIPLYTWLPDAMAGPTPVSALIHAATMVTAGIYMIARSNLLYTAAPLVLTIIAIIGVATALLAATIALRQNDIKKVLAYSTVSQLGFMFLALGSGAYVAAVFHVMTHAFFKALLFLGSGSVIHAMSGEQDIRKMGGLKKSLPITYWTFLIGCVAIAGIFPFSGFFSKDAILLSAFLKSPIFYVIALFTALLTAFYMFRLFFLTFGGSFRGTEEQRHHLHESPAAMTIPLVVLAILSIVGGWVGIPEVWIHGGDRLVAFLSPVIPVSSGHEISHATEYMLMGLSTGLVLLSILFAWNKYKQYRAEESESPFARLLENKWYVDELYQAAIVQPLHKLGGWIRAVFEPKVADGAIQGIGRSVRYLSQQFRLIQNGQTGNYALWMVIGIVVILSVQFFLRK